MEERKSKILKLTGTGKNLKKTIGIDIINIKTVHLCKNRLIIRCAQKKGGE